MALNIREREGGREGTSHAHYGNEPSSEASSPPMEKGNDANLRRRESGEWGKKEERDEIMDGHVGWHRRFSYNESPPSSSSLPRGYTNSRNDDADSRLYSCV